MEKKKTGVPLLFRAFLCPAKQFVDLEHDVRLRVDIVRGLVDFDVTAEIVALRAHRGLEQHRLRHSLAGRRVLSRHLGGYLLPVRVAAAGGDLFSRFLEGFELFLGACPSIVVVEGRRRGLGGRGVGGGLRSHATYIGVRTATVACEEW